MHELAIAQSIVEAVEERAEALNAARVKSVRLRIGEASGIVADSLAFCFEMLVSEYPVMTQAKLLIDNIPHRARCRDCDREFAMTNFITQCPFCEGWHASVVSGTELQIVEMEIET